MRKTFKIMGAAGLAALLAAPLSVTAPLFMGADAAAQSLGGFPIRDPNAGRTPTPGGTKSQDKDGKAMQIVVDANGFGKYKTISAALKDIGEGGIVYVLHGEYRESLDVKKSVFIQGDRGPGSGVEIIAPINQTCLTFNPKDAEAGAHAVVANLRFRSKSGSTANACIDVQQGVFTMKETNIVGGGLSPAVKIAGGVALLEKNTITGGTEGIKVEQTHSLSQSTIVDNKINANTIGIDLSGRADVIIAGNEIFDNRDSGLISDGVGGATVIGNKISNNAGNGIVLYEKSKISLLRYNRIVQNAKNGVYIPAGAPGVIEGNEIVGNGQQQIFLTQNGIQPKIINNIVGKPKKRRW